MVWLVFVNQSFTIGGRNSYFPPSQHGGGAKLKFIVNHFCHLLIISILEFTVTGGYSLAIEPPLPRELDIIVISDQSTPTEAVFYTSIARTGTEVEHTFRVQNKGKTKINLGTAKVSCDCLSLRSSNKSIDPGSIETVTVNVRASATPGSKVLGITLVDSNGNSVGQVRLVVEAKRLIELTPISGWAINDESDHQIRFLVHSSFLSEKELANLKPMILCDGFESDPLHREKDSLDVQFKSSLLKRKDRSRLVGSIVFRNSVGEVVETAEIEFLVVNRVELTPSSPFIGRKDGEWFTKFIVTAPIVNAESINVTVYETGENHQPKQVVKKLTEGSFLLKLSWTSEEKPRSIMLDFDGRHFEANSFRYSGD